MPRSHARTMSNLRLQRRHYQFISDAIREYYQACDGDQNIAQWFGSYLRGTNPNFDRARFLEACGDVPAPKPRCLLCQSEGS